MDELTPQEEITYVMLWQVLRNHIETHRLTWVQASTVSLCELGDLGLQQILSPA